MIMEAIRQFLAAVIGTVGFSVMFRVPRKYYPDCGIIGGLGWIFCWFLHNGLNVWPFLATLLATFVVTLTSRMWAAKRKSAAIMFLLPAIFPMIPGGRIYWTVYYLIVNELAMSAGNGRAAIAEVVAIVVGIMCAYEVPQQSINRLMGAPCANRK